MLASTPLSSQARTVYIDTHPMVKGAEATLLEREALNQLSFFT
ncbi:MAG: hypothetical protein WBG63_04945 [Phormidesmis sp.]